jgi:hypothetical protein
MALVKNTSEFVVLVGVPTEAMPKHGIPSVFQLRFAGFSPKFAEIVPPLADREPVARQLFIFFLHSGSMHAAAFEKSLQCLVFGNPPDLVRDRVAFMSSTKL